MFCVGISVPRLLYVKHGKLHIFIFIKIFVYEKYKVSNINEAEQYALKLLLSLKYAQFHISFWKSAHMNYN